MINNVGVPDRWLRVALGVALLSLVFYGPQTSWGWLGIVPIVTALVGFCPLYSLMAWSTERTKLRGP